MFRASVLKTPAAALSIAAALWALAIGLLGGFRVDAVAANDPVRPLIVALAAAVAYLALAGVDGARRDFRRHGARFITPLAIVLTVESGRVSQADISCDSGIR